MYQCCAFIIPFKLNHANLSSSFAFVMELIVLILSADRAPAVVLWVYIAAMLFFVFSTIFYTISIRWGKVIVDEMAKQHELESSNFALSAIVVLICVFKSVSKLNETVSITPNMVMCILFGIFAVKDIVYLVRERNYAA